MGVTALSDPMSVKFYLWHKGLRLWLWGEIVCYLCGFGACVYVCVCGCKWIWLRSLVVRRYCSAALLLLCALLSHQGGCWLSRSPLQHTAGKFHFLSMSCLLSLSPESWHTYASHIKDKRCEGGWGRSDRGWKGEIGDGQRWMREWCGFGQKRRHTVMVYTAQQCQNIIWHV